MILKIAFVFSAYFGYAFAEDVTDGRRHDESSFRDDIGKYLIPILYKERDGFKDGFVRESKRSDLGIVPNPSFLNKKTAPVEEGELIGKLLKTVLEHELKKEEPSYAILKDILTFLLKSSDEDLFLKKEELLGKEKVVHKSPELISKLKPGEYPINIDYLFDKLGNKESKSPLGESIHHKEEEGEVSHILKAILEAESVSKLPPLEKVDLKSIFQDGKVFSQDGYLKMDDILKKILESAKPVPTAQSGEEELKLKVPHLGINIPATIGEEHLSRGEMLKHFFANKPLEAVDEKTLINHKSPLEEAEIHKKDFVYDELLKHEEARELGDEFVAPKSAEIDSKSHYPFFPEEVYKAKEANLEAKTLSGKDFMKTDHVSHDLDVYATSDIIKEIGLDKDVKEGEIKAVGHEHAVKDSIKKEEIYPIGGTYAYAKAKEQAQKDAKIPATEDKIRKEVFDVATEKGKFFPGETFLKEEAVKIGISLEKGKEIVGDKIGSRKVYDEKVIGSSLAKEKEIVGDKVGERKIYEAKDIGSSLAKEGTTMFETKGKEEHIFRDGVAKDGDHFLHGIGDEKIHFDDEAIHKTLEVDSERPHGKAHSLRKKFLSFIGHVIYSQQCHLVSMRPGELLGIINCVSRSKDPALCEKFALCEKKKPLQVIAALEKCQKETIPEKALRCSSHEPLFPSPDIPLKIFQCVAKNSRLVLVEEKKKMMEFEECARLIKKESCGTIPWG